MRILFIVGPLYPHDLGGAEIHIVEVIKGLAKKGHRLEVFVGDDVNLKEIFDHENIHLHKITFSKIKNLQSITYAISAYKTIKKYLKNNKVDVIHAKQVFPQGLIGALLKNKFSIPYYITAQNPLAYKEELVLVNKLVPKGLLSILQNFLAPIIKYSLKKADITAAVSKYSEEKSLKLGAKKTTIIPNGIDEKVFFPDHKQPNNKFVITTTSTLIPRNGIDTLVKAFALICKRIDNCELNIAGQGPMRDELEDIIRREKIGDKVVFLGTIRHKEIPRLLNRSHVFARPSRFEGFGLSFIEAMACKIPVVTCPSGGIVDFVFDKETGFLVPPDNPEKLANTILEIKNNAQITDKVIKNAYDLVVKKYSWRSIVAMVTREYKKLR